MDSERGLIEVIGPNGLMGSKILSSHWAQKGSLDSKRLLFSNRLIGRLKRIIECIGSIRLTRLKKVFIILYWPP